MANPILGLNPIQILTPHKSPTGVDEHPALKSPPKSEEDILRELYLNHLNEYNEDKVTRDEYIQYFEL